MTSVFEHHRRLRLKLSERQEDGGRYRELLSELIGLEAHHIVSTAEHIAPFNVADSVSFLLPQLMLGEDSASVIHVLGGALVPLDNRQYPRGFLLNSDRVPQQRVNIFPQRQRKASALLLPPAPFTALETSDLPDPHIHALQSAAHRPASCYADQVSAVMETMVARWQLQSRPRPTVKVWPLEALATRILLALIAERDAFTMALLFDGDLRTELETRLDGVFCAWGQNHGSFLFWGCRDQRTLRLTHHAGTLRGGGITIPIEPEAVSAALKSRSILPGVYLSLMMVCYLPNLPVSGGPKQNQYLRRMISVTNDLLGMRRAPDLSATGYMVFDPSLLPARTKGNRTLHPYGIGLDLMLNGVDRDAAVGAMSALEVLQPSSESVPDYT